MGTECRVDDEHRGKRETWPHDRRIEFAVSEKTG